MRPIPTQTASHLPVQATAATGSGDGGHWRTWIGTGLLISSLTAADAWSFALGRAQVLSAIGEPLRVVVDLPALSHEEAETLQVSIAPPDAFQASGLEYKPLLSELKVEIERNPNSGARLKLQGNHAVSEAYVELLLQASWKGGQVTRDYTLLLGPADTMMPRTPSSSMAATTLEPRRVAAAPLPPLRPRTSAEKPAAPGAPPRTARQPTPEPLPAAAVEAAPAPAPEPVAAAPASPTVPAAAPAPAQVPAPAATAPPAVPEGQWLTQPTLLAAAALLLAGLTGWLVWRRQREQTRVYADEALLEPAGLALAAGTGAGLSIDTTKAQGPVSSMMYSPSQLEASGEIDPIAEADVYLAYGRVQQAEEILRDALRAHPDQATLHLKLLEIAVQRQDRAACVALMNTLSALTQEQGPDWNTATELAGRLPPDQPETGSASLAGAPTAAAAIDPATLAPAPLAQAVSEPDEAAALADLPALDLTAFAGSVQQAQPQAPTAVPEPAPAAASHAGPIELDFDLSLSAPEPAAALPEFQFEPEPEPARPVIASAPPQAPAADMALDFDLSNPDTAPAPTAQPTRSPVASPDNGLDFSLDLDQIGSASPSVPAPVLASKPADSGEPDLGLDFEFQLENKTDELADLVVSEDNSASDPLATQLELAQEFLALGDADGARSLAERVLARATGDLQARARALLEQLKAARPQ